MGIIYRLRSIRKSYGPNVVLDVDELTIAADRLYTLTGANGAGKSTLLALLAFLSPPTSGEIWFAGERMDWRNGTARRQRRKVTLLHQSPYLFRGSVYDNVAFGLTARGIRGEKQRQIVDEALEIVALRGFRDRTAQELSGGESQRVAMARAWAFRPEVLLLDEPLANLDREVAGLLEGVIASLPAQGTTVVMTTHDPGQPGRLKSETIVMERGRIVPPKVEK